MVNIDWDKALCYDTRQLVRIRDRNLGLVLIFWQSLICLYILFGVFVFGEGYLSYDQTMGGVAAHVKGDVVAIGSNGDYRYYSAEEITHLGLENGNIFVATRETVQKQKRGTCEDRSMPCKTSADCSKALGGTCLPSGYCEEPSWCPEGKPDHYDIDTKEVQVWIKSFVHFSLLDRNSKKDPFSGIINKRPSPFIFSTSQHNATDPVPGFNLFTVDQLLRECKPIPVRYEEVAELGAVIEVVLAWNCEVWRNETECKPEMKARRLDVIFDPEHIGFTFKWAEPISDTERVLHEMKGVRIFIRTVGKGSMFDANATILKFATTTSLLCLAPIISDVIMLEFQQNKERYRARKLVLSPEFGSINKPAGPSNTTYNPRADEEVERKLNQDQLDFEKRMREEGED